MTIEQMEALRLTLALTDSPMPLAFSKARVWRAPQYAVFGVLTRAGAQYAIVQHKAGAYDLSTPVYTSASIEDIADVWSIYA